MGEMAGTMGLGVHLVRRSYLHDQLHLFGLTEYHSLQLPSLPLVGRVAAMAPVPMLWWAKGLWLWAAGAMAVLVCVDYLANRSIPANTAPVATTEAMERFFAALLTGVGGLDRYVAPGTQIRTKDPAPYASVEVESVELRALNRPEDACRARVVVAATDAQGRTKVLHYRVGLVERQGQWEVVHSGLLPWPL